MGWGVQVWVNMTMYLQRSEDQMHEFAKSTKSAKKIEKRY